MTPVIDYELYNPPIVYNTKAYPDEGEAWLREACGFVPLWIQQFNVFIGTGSLVDWLQEQYGFGDLRSRASDKAVITDEGIKQYPEDPDMHPYASIETKLGTAYIYPYGFVAIPQGLKRKHLVVRMD